MPITITRLEIPDLLLIEPRVFGDERGFFLETYKHSQFAEMGAPEAFVQTNHSRSCRDVLRGLHYQLPPAAQGKLVMALRGAVFDVAVDLRRGSPTYKQWVGEVLSDENHRALYIPPGFAHGFCVLSDIADFVYQVTAEYSPAHDRGIAWDDPDIRVRWPVLAPLLSPKDAALPRLRDVDSPFEYEAPA